MNVRQLIEELQAVPAELHDSDVVFPSRHGYYSDIDHVVLAEGSDEPVMVVLS